MWALNGFGAAEYEKKSPKYVNMWQIRKPGTLSVGHYSN